MRSQKISKLLSMSR